MRKTEYWPSSGCGSQKTPLRERMPTMRKDVRLGFAVGGVLLAVIVVAVLVLHRAPKQDNTVVIDKTGPGATGDDTINVAPNASGQPSGVQQPPSDSEKHGPQLTTTDPPAPH